VLTIDQAHSIARTWRPRFQDETAFETSWSRFMEMTGDPTPQKLEAWLYKDQTKDAVRSAGIVREPALPQRQHFEIGDETSCSVCKGKRYIRRDVGIDHPQFGKALPCPKCS
jgi:hypothetical protein